MSKRKSKKISAIAVMSTLAVTALASSVSADTIIKNNSTLNGLQVSSGASNANINAQGKNTSISGDVVIKAPTTLTANSDATNPFKDAKVIIETNGTVTIEVPLKEVQINSNATIKLTPGKGSIERASVAPGKNPDLPPSVPGVGSAPNVSLSMETGKITKGKVKLVGTDSTMEYQIKAKDSDSWGTAWTSITGRDIELTASKDNVIRVRVKATTTTLASQARELTVRTENIGNPVVVNKKELNTKIGEANEKVKNKADYTLDSWQKANLESVIEAAKVVANKADATQTEVDAQVKAINEAIGKLVDKTIDTDQDAVNAEAAKIKSVTEPVKNAASLTLPTVGEGYTITIKSSNNESVIAKDGKITPPSTDTTVKLIFTVKHTVSGKIADTAEISVKVPAKTDADQDAVNAEAAKIKSVTEPVKNAASLTLPTVGEGYTITIKSSNNESVIAKDGKITPPSTNTTVKLIFTVKHTVSGKIADTAEISVKVPAKTAKQN